MSDDSLLQNLPPQNLQAEGALLGSLMVRPEIVGDIVQIITKDYFYSPQNQAIFQAITNLYDAHKPVDLVTVQEELSKQGFGGDADLSATLTDLAASGIPSAANAIHYANVIHDKGIARQLIAACNDTIKDAYTPTESLRDILERAERRMFSVSQSRVAREAAPVSEVLTETFRMIDALQTGTLTGFTTGFADLDEQIGGLHPSELIIVAARPSMGKTTLALNIAQHVCIDSNRAGVMFSMEMAKEQIVLNMLCALQESNFFIDDSPGLSIMELRAKCRRLKARHDIQLVVVDYIQLMEASSAKTENRQQEITEISRGLKTIARELEVPVIALSQLSRATEAREGHKPRMSDLRESGSIEQDADVIALLYREDYYYTERRPNEADVIIAKQRNGPTGPVTLTFLKEYMRFQNFTQSQ